VHGSVGKLLQRAVKRPVSGNLGGNGIRQLVAGFRLQRTLGQPVHLRAAEGHKAGQALSLEGSAYRSYVAATAGVG
jgi:hypothetical protein